MATKACSPGRPSMLAHVKERILEAIRNGLPLSRAALLAGVSSRTLMQWTERGRKQPGGVYGVFLHQVAQAAAEGEALTLEIIRKAARQGFATTETKTVEGIDADGNPYSERVVSTKQSTPSWQAGAFLLERRFPKRYGKRALAEAPAPSGELTPEEFAAKAAEARNAARATMPGPEPVTPVDTDMLLPEGKDEPSN